MSRDSGFVDGLPVRSSTDRPRCSSDGSRCGLRRFLPLPFASVPSSSTDAGTAATTNTAWLLLLSHFQSERRSSELHVVTLGDGEESSTAKGGSGGTVVVPVLLVSVVVLRGGGAVRHDLVEVGQVLRRRVDVPDALVVAAGPPRVRDVHGAAAEGVEREGPDAAADAAGEREDED